MIDTAQFIVRNSGRYQDNFYIDYRGLYKITEISEAIHLDIKKITKIYLTNKGIYDEELEVYYFKGIANAKNALDEILNSVKLAQKGKNIFLNEAELEYVRKALINESGTVGNNSRLKDSILKKLNI